MTGRRLNQDDYRDESSSEGDYEVLLDELGGFDQLSDRQNAVSPTR